MQFDLKKQIAIDKQKRKAYLASEIIGKCHYFHYLR